MIASGTQTSRVPLTRLMLSLSRTAAMTTSTMEIIEVKPARTRQAKKRKPKTSPAGIEAMSAGKVKNASPTPPSTSSQAMPPAWTRKPRPAKTPMPASTSNAELENATTRPELVRFVLRLR